MNRIYRMDVGAGRTGDTSFSFESTILPIL